MESEDKRVADLIDDYQRQGLYGFERAKLETSLPSSSAAAGDKQPKLVAWAEENIPEGFAVFDLPEAYRRKLRTSNACETLNSQIKRRTRVVGLFPSEESLERLVTAVLIEISEAWESGKSYLKPEN